MQVGRRFELRAMGWIGAGWCCVGLGVIGAMLPVMPTTCFLIAAAACFAKGSPRLHARLLAHPRVGPSLRAWEQHRAMPRRAKRVALLSIIASFAVSIAVVPVPWVRVLLAVTGVVLWVSLYRIPVVEPRLQPALR